MAEQIPYGIAESLIKRLASSVFAEFGRIYGVKDELAKLRETVESINARLLDAEERQEQEDGHAVKNWISRLKKVLHDADDLFDNFVAQDLRDKVGGHGKISRKARKFFSSSNPIVFCYNMACEIEAIQNKFNDVTNDMSKFNLHQGGRVFKENASDWRKTSSFVEESGIIGREKDREHIINLLMQTSDSPNVSLVVIVGIGGLGKTALAQLVYNDAQVQKFFAKRMWVCVSEDFGVETLLKKILKSLNNSTVDQLELEQLQKELRQSLSGQRYLLVLDDVWNKSYENWDDLRRYLMCGAPGSKILVTTRLKEAAKAMGVDTPYALRGLREDQSLALFKKLAFGENEKTINPNLLSIGEKFVEKCGGVPLAIRALGSLLRSKNENEWLRILDGDVWRSSEDTERVMAVLKLSYKHLPIELRQCFAYCSLCPKDTIIDKKELVQLWMAQGYIECSTEIKCMEDVGNDYVKILLMRSFFQDVNMNEYGDIQDFKMHDLMHDLAMLVAGIDCYLHGEKRRTTGTPTHLSLDGAPSSPLDLTDANRVRTIISPSIQNYGASLKNSLSIIWSCKSLRVLKLCYLRIGELPKSIGGLKHLRYFDLSHCTELRSLPKSICNLVHLQTLILNGCFKVAFFSGITKLISLRHLEGEIIKSGVPTGLGKLISLHTLKNFVVKKDPKFAMLNELKELNSLRGELSVKNLGLIEDVGLESKDVNLKEKKYLQYLELDWSDVNKNNDSFILLENLHPPLSLKELVLREYPGVRYPSWICSLTNIVSISLYKCRHIPRLDHLPLLKRLEIREMSGDVWCEYMSCFSSSSLAKPIPAPFFPSLETLCLQFCWQKEYVFLPPFPRLSYLCLLECRELSCIPAFPHLKELDWSNCNVKLLIDTVNMNKEGNPNSHLITNDLFHSSSFTPLSTLRRLDIYDIDPISINQLPEEWMQNLISLEHLSIDAHLFRSLVHLPVALKELIIWFFDEVDLYEAYRIEEAKTQGQPFHCLRSLQTLEVHGCSYMKELPEWIWNNPILISLPEGMNGLTNLQTLSLSNIASLPEGINCLTNLQRLYISGANSELCERCQRQRGADWPKIAHIPFVMVNGREI